MLMPSIFGEDLFDDFFGYPFRGYEMNSSLMSTDIKDTDGGYEVTMNLPGVKKEDVKAELKDGYLTINASSNSSKDEKDDNGHYIRRERYSGSCSRSCRGSCSEVRYKASHMTETASPERRIFFFKAIIDESR